MQLEVRAAPKRLKTYKNPDWGHPILTPEFKVIRVPLWAFVQLDKLGMLVREPNIYALIRISPMIHYFMDAQYDSLMGPLRRLLGTDMSGPEWTQCLCRRCLGKVEARDTTPLPRKPEAPKKGRYWLKVKRDPARG